MTTLEQKALKQAVTVLDSITSYPAYEQLYELLKSHKIDEDLIKEILTAYNKASGVEIKKVFEAKQWVETVLTVAE